MVVCGLLLLVAVALIVRWRGQAVVVPAWQDSGARTSIGQLLRIYLWLTYLGAVTGILAGLLVVGPGGRLAMRLLAATSPQAQGRITEAGEVVGDITLGGTLGFFVFVGLVGGPPFGILYVLVHRALPRGVLGGLVYGLALLVTFGAQQEPLRADNPDFGIVGPGWLAVAVFTLLAVVNGAFLAAAAGRLSQLLPLPGWHAFLYVPPVALVTVPALSIVGPVGLIIVAGGILFVLAGRFPRIRDALKGREALFLRVAVALVVLAFLPSFTSAVVDII